MERQFPFVSIIVPVYNGAATIVQGVESLLAQDYPRESFEIIVVDNGSKDRTVEILQPYAQSDKIVLLSETNILNAYGARNTGAKAAKGDILAFTDSDCVADKEWLVRLLAQHMDERIGAFIGDIRVYEPKIILERYYSSDWMSLRGKKLGGFPGMRGANCAIRHDCFERLKGFRDSVSSGGDSDFLRRMLQETSFIYAIALDALVHHENHETVVQIFKRSLRFGTNMENLRRDPFLGDNYVPLMRNLQDTFLCPMVFLWRLVAYPWVTRGRSYRGRKIQDAGLFLWEPLIREIETVGLLIGRIFHSPRFR